MGECNSGDEIERIVKHAVTNNLLRPLNHEGKTHNHVISKADTLFIVMQLGIADDAEKAYDIYSDLKAHDAFYRVSSGQYAILPEVYATYFPETPCTSSKRRKKVSLSGTFWKKGRLFWNRRYFKLRGRKLSYYDSPESKEPRRVIDIKTALFNYSDMSTWKTPFGFNFFVDDIYHHVCFDKSEQQERWITGLTTAGAHFSEHSHTFRVKEKSLYQFKVQDISGRRLDLGQYSNYVSLVINVASSCKLTEEQYLGCQELFEKYKEHNFVVLAFPCNQFGKQESGTPRDIELFVRNRLKITFPLLQVVMVNGPHAHPLWRFLRSYLRDSMGNAIRWNFTKFLVSKRGKPLKRYDATIPPSELEEDIRVQLELE